MLLWNDDNESGGVGWTHGDNTATATPHFHVDTYYAYDDGTAPNYSYWCGTFDYDADGGYGDGWVEFLELPPIDLTDVVNPRVSFRYRHHSVNVLDIARGVRGKEAGPAVQRTVDPPTIVRVKTPLESGRRGIRRVRLARMDVDKRGSIAVLLEPV